MNSPRGFLKTFQNSYLDACSVLCEDIAADFFWHTANQLKYVKFSALGITCWFTNTCQTVLCVYFLFVYSTKEMERNYGFNDTV